VASCKRCGKPLVANFCPACLGGIDAQPDDLDLDVELKGFDTDLDDPTELIGAAPARTRRPAPQLPAAVDVFEKATSAPAGLAGLERRMFDLADGLTPLKEIATQLGVNTLRAQHLAASVQKRGAIRRVTLFDTPE
jgi:hypothetical protein